jgi:hypothetical protein
MFIYTTLVRPIFWIVMGLIYALAIAGARAWAEDLGLDMTWWKCMLAMLWYVLLNIGVASGFTLIGEKEPRAGWAIVAAALIVMVVLGAGLWAVL